MRRMIHFESSVDSVPTLLKKIVTQGKQPLSRSLLLKEHQEVAKIYCQFIYDLSVNLMFIIQICACRPESMSNQDKLTSLMSKLVPVTLNSDICISKYLVDASDKFLAFVENKTKFTVTVDDALMLYSCTVSCYVFCMFHCYESKVVDKRKLKPYMETSWVWGMEVLAYGCDPSCKLK